MMRPRRTPAPPTVRVPAVTVTPVEPEAIAAPPAAAPETVKIDVAPTTSESTTLIPYAAVTVPEGLRPSVTIVRSGRSADASLYPRPQPLPREHRLRVHGHTLLALVLLAVICLAGAIPLENALRAGGHYPAGLKLVNGHLIPSGPLDPRSAEAPLGVGGGVGPGVAAPGTAGLPVVATPVPPQPTTTPVPQPASDILPAPFSPWPPTNPWIFVQPAFALGGPGNFYPGSFGQCTWWALKALANEGYSTTRMENLGDAKYWAADAAARGFVVVSTPLPDSTVVFQPGVEGAGGGGHVAHVLNVYPDGWFEISEMNFYRKDNGVENGGWGIVDYRYAYATWGVSFIVY